jgi:hypothetical protein
MLVKSYLENKQICQYAVWRAIIKLIKFVIIFSYLREHLSNNAGRYS